MQPNITNYDTYIVAFSGGKDSIACFLHLLDIGIPKSKIELWHHCIDGREGSTLMDWPVTEDYCRKFARAFGVPIYFSWKQGGFEKEMTRYEELTAPVSFEYPDDNLIECGVAGGIRGNKSTRLKFPQVSADLKVRWCSAYLKIDVCTMAINNQPRFNNSRTLVISGERAQESPARAKYNEMEPDRSDNRNGKSKRHVDHWRPVHKWMEKEVWEIIKRYRVNPHPAYLMGWGRLSCMFCIFGSANQFASANQVAENRMKVLISYEQFFSVSIKRNKYLPELIATGEPYKAITNRLMRQAISEIYKEPILIDNWKIPAGAFGESTGPT
jgi:3'-phosphoadenosine 5'-phosphosulfate sulfotransferase (PAPS reductase)/FAD synthetase